jgi:quercetin dioxygenase-like cupin family protein
VVNIEEPMSSERVFRLDDTLRTDLNGDGVHWTLEGDSDLNVNLVHLDPGSGVETHANREVDVVVIVVEGNGRLCLDGTDHALAPNVLAVIPKGIERSVSAGPDGLSYLTVHRRRAGLGIARSRD